MNSALPRARGVLSLIALAAAAWLTTTAADASNPGDIAAATRRLRERAAALEPLQPVTPGLTRDVGNIAVVEHDGSSYAKLEPDGTLNYAARARVARRFYETHGDRYDFLLVFTNFPFDTGGAVAFHGLVRNDVTGIGMSTVNHGPWFGSPGRLKGYVDMALVDQFRHAPFSGEPGTPGFDDAVNVITHEVGHQWLASVRYRDAAGVDSHDLLDVDGSHWSYLLDSDASLMYGSDWTVAGPGVFRASRVRLGYSALDLYLMGLLESARVPPFTLLRNPTVDPAQLPLEGATVVATPEAVAIGQVIAAEAPRAPDYLASQKDFRMGVLLLVAPGVEPDPEDLELVDRMRTAFASRFFALTRGVAFMDTTLAEQPLPDPLPAPDLDGALAWLRARQAPDGRWEDARGTSVRDTAVALDTLREAAVFDVGYSRGQAWLASAEAGNVDFLARRARARAPVATGAERAAITAALFAAQHPDGGFGAALGYESDGLDTALALAALRELQAPADARVRRAFAAIGALQEPTGGWALVPGQAPSTVATALVLSALQAWADQPEAAVLLPPALAALLARQNDDGGFGESPSTAHGTALALLALDRSGAPGDAIDDAIAWLQRTQAQDRSWNGRAYETALAIRALKGRTAPNLLLRQDDLALSPAHAEEGEVVMVSARVRNDGRLASAPSLLRLYDGPPAAANAVGEVAVPALEPMANALVIVPFDTHGRAGTRVLTAVVDPDRTLTEVREDDNAAARSLVVEGPQADLSVTATDIVVVPYPPEAAEAVAISVTVRNQGDREAPATEVRFVRTSGGTSATVGHAVLAPLAPGDSALATVSWTAPAAPGTSTLTATADAQFAVPESDETNNAASMAVEVTPAGGNGPDLEVPFVTANPVALSAIPQTFAVRTVVRNLARDPLSSTVAIFDGTPETGTLLLEQPITLEGRAGAVIEVPFEVVAPGDRTLTAVVDRGGIVTETNETNNRAVVSIDDPGNTFDVAVGATVPNAPEVVVGETVTVVATVTNRGTRPFGDLPVVLGLDGATLDELDRASVTLGPGQSTQVTLSWTSTVTGTPVPLVVVADPFDVLSELDEANNRRAVPVDVHPSSLGNLRVTGADLTFTPDPPLQGGTAVVAAVVRNPSPVGVGAFVVRFLLGDPAAGGLVIGEAMVPGLAAATAATASIEWAPVDVHGQQGLWAVADALAQVEEYDEADNVGFRPFQAVSLPDLAISSAEFVLEPAFPHVGEEAAFRVTVRNVGDRPAVETALRVFDGEPASGTLIGERQVPALAPGQSIVLSLPWTAATQGERQFSVLADASDAQPEANEGNNLSRRLVVVQDTDVYVTAAYFSPDGDGAFDETTVVYRAGDTPFAMVQISDARGQLVRTLATEAPAQGQVVWDGRGEAGRLLWDGSYTATVRAASGVVRGRARIVLDTNRSDIHSAAGTGAVAVRTFDPGSPAPHGVAWMPAEDEFLTIVVSDDESAGFQQGLLRVRLDGNRSYVALDGWFAGARFASRDAVAPDGREVLVVHGADVVAVDLLNGSRRLVTSQGAFNDALWSPDGRRILVGDTVYGRDATEEATLPGEAWQWSPDGEHLLSRLTVIRRDGDDRRDLSPPAPIPPSPTLGDACLFGTHWRGDGKIVANVGRMVLDSGEGGTFEVCIADRVFVIDPDSGGSVEVVALRGRPYSTDWSPEGSRLLYQDAPSSGGWETHVAREADGLPIRLWTAKTYAAPRGLAAYGCIVSEQCQGSLLTMTIVTSLRNLTADLAAIPLPGDYGILLKGSATDANLDRYELDYATSTAPGAWTPIGPASDQPIVNGLLGTWVPDAPGTYLVRLRVWDRAGNARAIVRVVAWNHTPAIGNITQSEYLISPTGDGVKDEVRFDYFVHEPTHLDVRIVGPEPPPGSSTTPLTIRQLSFDLDEIGPGAFSWNGRDQAGALVADGRYMVYLNGIPFRVDLDATPPEIAWSHDAVVLSGQQLTASFDEVRDTNGCLYAGVSVDDIQIPGRWHVVDANLEQWTVGPFSGTDQVFVPAAGEYLPDGTPVVKREDGRPVAVERLFSRSMYARLFARDRAGNTSLLDPTPLDEALFATGSRATPDCSVPQGSQLAPTQPVTPLSATPPAVNRLPLKSRLFFDSGPFGAPGAARFEFKDAAGAWVAGPTDSHYIDLDLPALGLAPGPTYLGRIASEAGLKTEEFPFSLCRESMALTVALEGGSAGLRRYRARVESTVSAPLATLDLNVRDDTTGFHVAVPFERTGPTSYEAVVVVPASDCDATPPPDQTIPLPLVFEVSGRRQDGQPLYQPSEKACFALRRAEFACENDLALWEESTTCATAAPDRATLNVFSRSASPNATVKIDAEGVPLPGTPYLTGDRHCGENEGLPHQYCDRRQLTIDLAPFPPGTLELGGELADPSPLAQAARDLVVDRTAPVVTMHGPMEGEGVCVEHSGSVERIPLRFEVEDQAEQAEVLEASFRYGDGPWRPLCLGYPGLDAAGQPTWRLDCAPPTYALGTGQTFDRYWTVTGQPDGEYTVRFELCDGRGNRSTFARRFTIFRGETAISMVSVDPAHVSPNGDGRADAVTATIRLPQPLRMTVVVRATGANGTVVRTLADDQTLPAGDRAFVWDGRDGLGAVVPEGAYWIVATGTNACGAEDTTSAKVVLDLTSPVVTVTSPSSGAAVNTATDVLGRAIDDHFARYELEYGAGAAPPGWTLIQAGASPVGDATAVDLLGTFVPPAAEGPYTLRLVARDRAQNEAEARVEVEVGERAFLDRLNVTPRAFSPNDDGRRDTTTIEYVLLAAGKVTLEVRDAANALVRLFESGADRAAGTFAVVWNGTTDAGAPAPEGALRVHIRVEDPESPTTVQEASAALLLDRTPPTVAITAPPAGADVANTALVRGSIDDAHLVEYTVEGVRPFSPAFPLGHGTQSVADGDLGSLAAVPDGPLEVRVRAEDSASNVTEFMVPIVIDSVAPQALVESPLSGAVLDRGTTPVTVTGLATDARLERWDLTFGPGALPAYFVPIASGTEGGTDLALGQWSIASLPDGTYTLRLVVRDRAGHESESRATVGLDSDDPTAVIGAPAEGAFLSAAGPIDGTASDLNLERWTVEASPGAAATAFQWSPLTEGISSVTNGTLGEWTPLPPDGLHTLRLTVRDRAGHVSRALRTATIDTTAPQSPTGLASEVRPAGSISADVVLTWIPSLSTDVAGYRVTLAGAEVLAPLVPGNTYVHVGVSEGTRVYEVRAIDRAGNASVPAPLTVRVDLTPPLADILSPVAGARVNGAVEVRGTAYSPDDFAEYRLLVGAGETPSQWTLVRRSTVPVSAGLLGTWIATMAGPHVLALQVEDSSGNLARTTVAVFVDQIPPPAPHLLSVTSVPPPGPSDTLIVRWDLLTEPDVVGYLVYRNDQLANAPGVVIGDLRPYAVSGPKYADALLPDGAHRYHVVAMDEAGNVSAPSEEGLGTLDNRRPHAVLVAPPAGTRFEFPIQLVATTPDLDVTSVQFELRPAVGSWSPIGAPDTDRPFERTLDPAGLAPGEYLLRAVATDLGGPDETPTDVSVVYGDATAPDPPTNLTGFADGGAVTLTWSAGPEPDLAGYHVYRDGARLTTDPLVGATFGESRTEGEYGYAVTAVDADGNESAPAQVRLELYRPELADVVPPQHDGPTVGLAGRGARGTGSIEVVRDGVVVAQASVPAGTFALASVPLAVGPNVLTARERDGAGHASLESDAIVVIRNDPPEAVTGLAAEVEGLQVALSWDALAAPPVFGYDVRRGGTSLIAPVMQGAVYDITASSDTSGHPRYQAYDGDQETSWIPAAFDPTPTWTVEFQQPERLVQAVVLRFADPSGPAASPAHRVQAEWDGHRVTLAASAAGVSPVVSYVLSLPFATDRIRVEIEGAPFVGLAEVEVLGLPLVPKDAPSFVETVLDGVHSYEVAAVDRFGSRGASAAASVPVGDVDTPPAPSGLMATVSGSAVTLEWQPVSVPDLDRYVVLRDDAAVAHVADPTHVDLGRPNGTYVYTVRARDAAGNESADSAPATAVVQVEPPPPPVLTANASPDGPIVLTWTHAGAPHFEVARAITAGGPYTLIERTDAALSYVDASVRPGERVFYVVRAEDSLGNLSPASNEASALPVMPRPVLLRPTDAAHPITLATARATFVGRAFPDALVALTVDDMLRDVATAGHAYEPIALGQLPPGTTLQAMSTDGRVVAFSVDDPLTGTTTRHWADLLTGASGSLPLNGVVQGFSADERRLADLSSTCDDTGCTSTLTVLDLESGAATTVGVAGRQPYESAWSPVGHELAVLSAEPGESASRLEVLDSGTGDTRIVSESSETEHTIRWSHDGSEIAVVRYDADANHWKLLVHPSIGGGTALVGPEGLQGDAPEWDRAGRRIGYQGAATLALRSWDLDTGVIEELTSVESATPRFSRSGRYFSYFSAELQQDGTWSNRVTVRDRTSGVEHVIPTPPSLGGSSAPSVHSWQAGDLLALGTVTGTSTPTQIELALLPPFDGAFRVPDVPLAPGVNVVEVEAIETQTGGISDPSESVAITTPLGVYPDLAASPADLASYPTLPLAGQLVALSARIRNFGQAPASELSIRLELRGPSGILLDQVVTLSSIPAGGSGVASAYWTATAPGTYLLRVMADADGTIPESNEANNAAEVAIHVTAAAELVVTATTDHASYPAHAPVRVHVDVANGGAPWSGIVRTDVATAAGATVAALDERPLAVGYGQTAALDLQWNTAASLAGDYVVRVQALVGDTVATSAGAPFRIEPHTAVWARVAAVDATVPPGSTAQFAARIENRGANTVLGGLSARLRIQTAAGATVFEATELVPTLLPGAGWDGSFSWSPAAPIGMYAVRLDAIAAGGSPLANAEAALEVQAASGLSGTLALDPAHVLAGVPLTALATVTNPGPDPLVGQAFAVEVRNGQAILVSVPFSLDLPGGATRSATVMLPTGALSFGTHPVFLRAAGAVESLHRETLHVHAGIVAPSIDAPADGTTVAANHPVLSVNDATTASGSPLTYAFEVYRDAALTMQIPGASGVPETPQRTSWTVSTPLDEDARYWWRARATDGFSNSAWTTVASFRVDAQNAAPHSPRTERPRDGDTVATRQPELVVVNAFDPDVEPLTYDFRVARDAAMLDVVASLSGVPETAIFTRWTVPTPLDEDASYFWSARAQDPYQASPWTLPARFLVDTTNLPPSAVPLLRPDDGAEIAALTAELAVGPAIDPEGDALTYRFQVDRVPTFDSPDLQLSPEVPLAGGEAVWTPPLPLSDNAHAYWRAAAHDAHSIGPWSSRRFFVNLANEAPIAPVPLAPGAGTVVTTPTPTLRVQNALDPDLDLLTYEFEVHASGVVVGSVAGVPQGVVESLWTVPEPLAENGSFTWRARAHDGALAGPWTAHVPFLVNAVDDPPTAPTLVAPAEGAVLAVPPAELVVANAASPDLLELTYDFALYAVHEGGVLVLVDSATGVPSGPTQTAWSPTAMLVDGGYSWRARATDLHQVGPWMDSAHFTLAVDPPPAAPTGLAALAGDSSVALSWSPNTDPDLAGYRVYRGASPGGPYVFVAATGQPSYDDSGLVNGQTVYYVVTALDAIQEGPRSAEASATPRSGPVPVQVAYWPAVVEGECLRCPGTPPGDVPHFGPLRPVLECVVEEAGANTTTAYFGFDNGTAAVMGLPIGPANFFTPSPEDRGQPETFTRGRTAGFPGVFGVPFTVPQITWTLGGESATAMFEGAQKSCPLPPITCRRWLHATLEPPAGHDPASIDVATLMLGGYLRPDPSYQVIVDRDDDLLPELEVRFEQEPMWLQLQTGSNALDVTGRLGPLDLIGAAFVEVGGLKARADFTPAIYSTGSRHPRVELVLRGCYGHTAIDVGSIRLNGVVPVRQLISSTPARTIVEFDRDASIAILPPGPRVEIVVTGLANGQPFRAVDYIKVQP